MNQILSTSMPKDNKKKKNSTHPIAIGSILKFFAVAILVFGTFMIGTGAYAIYQSQSEKKQQNLKPTISIENKTDNTVLLKVVHQKVISTVEYWWNEQEKTVINGNNGQYLEKEIEIPIGNNTLHIVVTDINGNQETYDKIYEIESNINIEVSGNKIKITYDGDKNISYMTYRWDEEDEKRVEINSTTIDYEIDAIKGLHTLTVIVVDEENNTDTKIQKVNGVSKPQLSIGLDDTRKHFVIKASDEEKLSKIEIKLNKDESQQFVLNLEEKNLKELEYTLQKVEFKEGENFIEVKVYNSNQITTESAAKFVK